MTPYVASAPAKVNFGLRVFTPDRTGYHPLSSLVQTIDLVDELEVSASDDVDRLTLSGMSIPHADDNLVWKAFRTIVPERTLPLHIALLKRIPAAAGLGGGSSDAAAALLVASSIFDRRVTVEMAASIGADVPFLLSGGTALMEGYGEAISQLPAAADYTLALVVPPIEIPTPLAFSTWDEMGGPAGEVVPVQSLPPSLREYAPLRNDLYPAAVKIAPQLEDWSLELAHLWNRPVMMSGSGASLFAFFASRGEAEDAAQVVPGGTRFAGAVQPTSIGASVRDG